MKFNFKKIASVLAGTVMMSSTLAFAAAANYPAPFVQNGSADVAIVYGSQPGAEFDLVAVADITSNLQAALAAQTATSSGSPSGSSTVSGGDYVKLERSSDKFNLGENAADFYSSLGDDELGVVLADGIYQNDDNDEYDYTQKIELSNDLILQHFQDNDYNDDKPVIGFKLTNGDHVLNYTLDFTDQVEGGANFASLETTDLPLLGRTYYIVQAQNISGSPKLTLLDSANSAIVTEGQTTTITAGNKSYSVGINFIDSDNTILTVDGSNTNKLQEGDVYKVADDTYVAVKNILYSSKDTGVSKVEVSIGSGKIVLQNDTEVQINNEDISDIDKYNDQSLTAYITNSGENIDKIVLSWDLGDDTFLAPGSDLVLPGFETIKLSMGGFTTPKEEVTTLKNDGEDSIKLSTYVEDGKVDLNLLYANDTNFIGTGKDSNKRLVTTNNSVITVDGDTDEWFVASWMNGDDAESYVLELSSISDNPATTNTTKIKSVAGNSDYSFDIGEQQDIGRVRLTLTAANKVQKTATFSISPAGGSGSVSFNRLYTKDGLRIALPVINNTLVNGTNTGALTVFNNATATSVPILFTEADEDGNVAAGSNFTANVGITNDGKVSVSGYASESVFSGGQDFETDDSSDNYIGYINSSVATKTMLYTGGDQDYLEVTYHGDESFADVYVAEAGAAVESTGVTVSNGSVKELGSILVKDSEVSSVANKNLIVVGGSCVNTLARDLLEGAGCGSDFTAKTGVGAGSFLVQTFSRTGGKVATLVAGYNAADTQNAAKVLTSPGAVDVSAGKKYVSTSATTVALQTTETA